MSADLMLFGIEILNCEDIDITDESVQYNGVTFLFDSLSQYDGMTIEVAHDWKLKVWDYENNILAEFFIIDNYEFREKLYDIYPLNK